MNIPLPVELEQRINPEMAALHLALGLYAGDEVTLGQAAAIAKLTQPAFLQQLGMRKIPVHYGSEEVAEDIATVERLSAVKH